MFNAIDSTMRRGGKNMWGNKPSFFLHIIYYLQILVQINFNKGVGGRRFDHFFLQLSFSLGSDFTLPIFNVATLTLGSQPRQRLVRLWAKREAWESHFMLPGMQNSVREWALTLLSELPFWELETQWTPKFLEGDCRGQKSIGLRCSLYHCKYIET